MKMSNFSNYGDPFDYWHEDESPRNNYESDEGKEIAFHFNTLSLKRFFIF